MSKLTIKFLVVFALILSTFAANAPSAHAKKFWKQRWFKQDVVNPIKETIIKPAGKQILNNAKGVSLRKL